jgi:hypothetical protein
MALNGRVYNSALVLRLGRSRRTQCRVEDIYEHKRYDDHANSNGWPMASYRGTAVLGNGQRIPVQSEGTHPVRIIEIAGFGRVNWWEILEPVEEATP